MLKAKDIMTKNVLCVEKNTKVRDICKLLIKHRLSGLPVVDKEDNLVGFISQRDIIARVALQDFLKKKAKDLMVKKVLYVFEDTFCDQISRIFTEKPYHYLPVIKAKKVVGIISRKDVIGRLLGQYY